MGVSILKLEGRMKRPEYVAVVTRIYAALLKENRKPTAGERRQLELAFSREGFTDGYWRGRLGPGAHVRRLQRAAAGGLRDGAQDLRRPALPVGDGQPGGNALAWRPWPSCGPGRRTGGSSPRRPLRKTPAPPRSRP